MAQGVEVLERELEEARERLKTYEARLAQASRASAGESFGAEDPDSIIGRTLRLAQETAATLRRDAEAEAEALRAEAHRQAARLIDEARQRARAMQDEFLADFEGRVKALRARSEELAAGLSQLIERVRAEGSHLDETLQELARHTRVTIETLLSEGSSLASESEHLRAASEEMLGDAQRLGSSLSSEAGVVRDPSLEDNGAVGASDVVALFGDESRPTGPLPEFGRGDLEDS